MSMRGAHKVALAVLWVLLSAYSQRANAGPIFSTFGPGDSYWPGGTVIGQAGSEQEKGYQFMFADTYSYYLDMIELPVSLYRGTNELNVWLMTDDGDVPGTIIESFSFIDAMGPYEWGRINPLLIGNSMLHPILAQDTKYWLVASGPAADTEAIWHMSYPQVIGLEAMRMRAGPWAGEPWEVRTNVMSAFRISGTVIPAPGAFVLGVIGASLVGYLLRSKTL